MTDNYIELSKDGMELTVLSPAGNFATIRSSRPHGFTPEDLQVARTMSMNSDMVPGQVNRMRSFRLGQRTVFVSYNTGPPTWWLPRMQIKDRRVMAGWLRALVAVAIR